VTGKGGVGRSTVAAALASREVSEGRRVLVIDAVGTGGLASALGVAAPEAGRIMSTSGGPSILTLSTEAALDQYVSMNLRIPIAPSSLGPVARIFDYVATAAPAVREILTIGKISHEVRRGPWDLVVVDGPATGHVVELLNAPRSLGDLVGFGPIAAETRWMVDLLADPDGTTVLIASLAEELPVDETELLLGRIRSETDLTVTTVVANRLPPPVGAAGRAEARILAEDGDPLGRLAVTAVDRHLRATEQLARLRGLGVPVVEVEERTSDPLAAVADGLTAAGW
jgi:anion-transporting  ArsA/GET3 family ATPase